MVMSASLKLLILCVPQGKNVSEM